MVCLARKKKAFRGVSVRLRALPFLVVPPLFVVISTSFGSTGQLVSPPRGLSLDGSPRSSPIRLG